MFWNYFASKNGCKYQFRKIEIFSKATTAPVIANRSRKYALKIKLKKITLILAQKYNEYISSQYYQQKVFDNSLRKTKIISQFIFMISP